MTGPWNIPNVCPMSGLGIIDNEGELDRVQICHCTCGAYVDVVSGRVTPHSKGVDTLSDQEEA